MKIRENKKGITLIALVVTIVVLLILAAISLNLVFGDNGIIKRVMDARERNEIEAEIEKIKTAWAATQIEKSINSDFNEYDTFEDELDNNFGENKTNLIDKGDSKYTVEVIETNRKYDVNGETGEVNKFGEIGNVDYPSSDDYKDIPDSDSNLFIFDKKTGSINGLNNADYYDKNVAYPSVIKIPEKIDGVEVKSVRLAPMVYKTIRNKWNNEIINQHYGTTGIVDVTDVIIPNTVTTIDYNAFKNFVNLKNVVLSNKLTTISERAFAGCTSLETIKIPNTVNYIGESAFYKTSSLKEITINSPEIELGKSCFSNSGIRVANITGNVVNGCIEGDLDIKNQSAFYKCENLEKIVVNKGHFGVAICNQLAEIDANIFAVRIRECTGLEKIKANEIIGNYFGEDIERCENLSYMEIGKEKYSKAKIDAEFGDKSNEDNSVLNVEYKSSTITADETESYYDTLERIKEINIPEGVTKIEPYAFSRLISSNCQINLPSTIKEIGDHAFEPEGYARNISVNLPEGLEKIGNRAFGSDWNEVIIPSTVTEIGDSAFGEVTTFKCRASSKPSGWNEKWNYSEGCEPYRQEIIWNYKD